MLFHHVCIDIVLNAIMSRDDPKGPGPIPTLPENDSEDEEEVVTENLFHFVLICAIQVTPSDTGHICLCEFCPTVLEDESICCYYAAKNRTSCEEESVSCVIKLKKVSKIWDKARNI